MFATVLNRARAKHTCCRVLLAMEPSGLDWLALYERLIGCGYEGCLGNCPAVCHHRKTMQESPSKTETKDADSVVASSRRASSSALSPAPPRSKPLPA
jgi:hypothetical protein